MRSLSVRIDADPPRQAALSIARRLHRIARRHGRVTMALSGGSETPAMLAELLRRHQVVDWSMVDVWQVDERVAPDGHPDRNANQLAVLPCAVHLMPVTAPDLPTAAAEYAATLPERFDVVHLGMGPDGHTASWPPDDPVAGATSAVALSRRYDGRVRMTLTPGPVNAAAGRVVLITGAAKAPAVAAWIEDAPFDGDLPIRRVERRDAAVILDQPAAALLTTW